VATASRRAKPSRRARRVLAYQLATRTDPSKPFAFTNGHIRGIAARTVGRLSDHPSREIRYQLLAAGAIKDSGKKWESKSGYWVTLYVAGNPGRLARISGAPHLQSSVGRSGAVKAWTRHPLFGFGAEEHAESLSERLRQWKEPPEWATFAGRPLYEFEEGWGRWAAA